MFFFAPGGLAAGGWAEVAAAGMAAGPGRGGPAGKPAGRGGPARGRGAAAAIPGGARPGPLPSAEILAATSR